MVGDVEVAVAAAEEVGVVCAAGYVAVTCTLVGGGERRQWSGSWRWKWRWRWWWQQRRGGWCAAVLQEHVHMCDTLVR